MFCLKKRLFTIFVLLGLFVNMMYAGTASSIPLNNKQNIAYINERLSKKLRTLQKINKSHTTEYVSLYDEIAELTISKNKLLMEMERSDDIDTDKTCNLAMQYEKIEFIKTEYYKTPFHDEVAKTLKNNAILYEQCHPPMAEKYWHSFLKIIEHTYSRESAEAAMAHDLLGDYYRLSMTNFKKAITEYNQAKEIRERLYGANNVRVTKNFGRLALSIYYHGGDIRNKAEKLLLDAVRQRKSSEKNPDFPLYQAYMDIGNYYALKGDNAKRIEYYKKAKKTFTGNKKYDYEVILNELSIASQK